MKAREYSRPRAMRKLPLADVVSIDGQPRASRRTNSLQTERKNAP